MRQSYKCFWIMTFFKINSHLLIELTLIIATPPDGIPTNFNGIERLNYLTLIGRGDPVRSWWAGV
jgi:hypothetical protein